MTQPRTRIIARVGRHRRRALVSSAGVACTFMSVNSELRTKSSPCWRSNFLLDPSVPCHWLIPSSSVASYPTLHPDGHSSRSVKFSAPTQSPGTAGSSFRGYFRHPIVTFLFKCALTKWSQEEALGLLHPLSLSHRIASRRIASQGITCCAFAQQLPDEPRIMH